MPLMTHAERGQRVRAFVAKLNGATKEQLVAFKQDLANKMARGFSPIGDVEGDLEALQALYSRLTHIQAQQSPAEELDVQAKKLAQEYGVSVSVATNYITKKHIKAAPLPEEPVEHTSNHKEEGELSEKRSNGRYHL
jgi:hypothetical protein